MSDAVGDSGVPVVDLPASGVTSAESAVKFLVAKLVQSGRLPAENADIVARQVLHRESLGSTGIGRGVARPHAKSDVVFEVMEIAGRSEMPVNWPGTVDLEPVRLVYLLVTPASEPEVSFRALEATSRKLRGA